MQMAELMTLSCSSGKLPSQNLTWVPVQGSKQSACFMHASQSSLTNLLNTCGRGVRKKKALIADHLAIVDATLGHNSQKPGGLLT